MMPNVSRRAFLSTTSLAAAGVALGARRLSAVGLAPELVRRSGTLPSMWMADPLAPDLLRSLATAAVDAARAAGATYADVRVAESQRFMVFKTPESPLSFYIDGDMLTSFGVRATVGGTWGFVHGDVPTTDTITAAAQGAVVQARQVAKIVAPSSEYLPAPAVTGEWKTPIQIDPFTVPIHEQMALIRSWMDTCGSVWGVGGLPGFEWTRETRVLASTDGSLVTQHFYRSSPGFTIGGDRLMGGDPVGLSIPLSATTGGYETVADTKIHDQIRATGEEVQRLAGLPGRMLDVGRYPVVMDGMSFGNVLYKTLGVALELDRVLGLEADASGTSYLAPVEKQLGVAVASPVLTITADRTLPSVTSVKWDDEGVAPAAGPVMINGQLMDYQTSRMTAGTLATWYQQHDRPMVSRGCAVAPEAQHPVQVRCGHLTALPNKAPSTIDDLIHDMAHGVIVRNANWLSTDQQLTTGNLPSDAALFLEVEHGRIVRRVKNAALEWSTLPLLKKLLAVGDQSTVQEATGEAYKGVPWHPAPFHATAPAALFKEVNVINTGREL